MASAKKKATKAKRTAPAKGKPAAAKKAKARGKPAKKAPPRKAAPKKAPPKKAAPKKAAPKAKGPDKKKLQAQQAAAKKKADEARKKAAAKNAADKKKADEQKALAKQREQERRAAVKKKDQERREREAIKARERAEREAKKAAEKAEREAKKAAEKAEREAKKEAEKAEREALKAAEKAAKKKPVIPRTSLAATPIFRPLTAEDSGPAAPPPPPAKPGHVDHQVLSAISYGIFAAVNKAFGFAGQSVVKNAALRILEYGYKRGWLPPKAKEPVRALNEFFGRLETMGYAEKIHVGKRGDSHVLEVQGLADYDAVHNLKELHYPLLPIFLGEMLTAIVDQYFGMLTTTEPIQMHDEKRGFTLPFSIHERPQPAEVSRLVTYSRVDDFEE